MLALEQKEQYRPSFKVVGKAAGRYTYSNESCFTPTFGTFSAHGEKSYDYLLQNVSGFDAPSDILHLLSTRIQTTMAYDTRSHNASASVITRRKMDSTQQTTA